jgi:hypothetical protein
VILLVCWRPCSCRSVRGVRSRIFFFFLAQADWIGSRFPHWKGRVVWSPIIAIFSIIFVCPCVREAVSAAGGEFLQLQKGKRPEMLCSSSIACVEEASRN